MEANTIPEIEALYATGHWLHGERRHGDAIRVFHAMLLCAPSDERGWVALGACHEALGNQEVAHAIYQAAQRAVPQPLRSAVALARLARELGRDDEAADAYEAAALAAEAADDESLAHAIRYESRAS
jgi:tetratricopeptide (TPR) repeat protein